jgi:hypothetical protein
VTHRSAVLPTLLLVVLAGCDARSTDPVAPHILPEDAPAHAAAHSPAHGASPIVVRFRSEEDPAFPPDPAVCAAAPFAVNVRLGASLWAEASNASGAVKASTRRVGTATACVQITDPTFALGNPQRFYARFDLPEGRVTADGQCSAVSNDVPTPGLVLAGCFLRAVEYPDGYVGGAVTSLSIFNPANLPGFTTGSSWTVQLYRAVP